MKGELRFKRILFKISGEMLKGKDGFGIDPDAARRSDPAEFRGAVWREVSNERSAEV